ncbi:MAG: 1,4-alpha-glucan branching protein GlgB [Chloroflexi bacterium]|nr:MAG: 1,4-alpha-glucan branching protein GlgB [Chloroflexota bacterium]
MSELSTIPLSVIESIVAGTHGDPFAVLGPHALDENCVVVRAFLPTAVSVSVRLHDTDFPMTRIHEAGFYEVILPEQSLPLSYQLLVLDASQKTHLYEDPYNFPPVITGLDEYLLAEGTHWRMYEKLGAHLTQVNGVNGVLFAVWAPNAQRVSVIGNFNNWDGRRHPMRFHHDSGIWELFVPHLGEGELYKYEIRGHNGYLVAKADPVGFYAEKRPNTASIVWNINKYTWQDTQWMQRRHQANAPNAPISIYEVHLGSWQRREDGEWLSYEELSQTLIPYVKEMGYTHIELLPIAEHPYDGSWGYQVTGYFAPTSRYGPPEAFMAFVDTCHQAGIGVILDWVPAHFPTDQHGLGYFDGTHLYEHADPRQGYHPDWGTLIFNYGRREVRQFLVSNALFWLDKYHIDGLRVDAVASMLYLDFSRKPGEWIPNRYGGRENLDAIEFIKTFNQHIHEQFPDVITIAEESTAWPGVTQPVENGGLGFDFKWNMGWMHDTLKYMQHDPIYRSHHHGMMTFSLLYAFSEKFLLPFSHDEVVHLKKSMLDKMPGDLWQKFANLRLLYGYQYAHPGKKLLFMGGEIGQWREWSEARSLDWHLLEDDRHLGLQKFVRDLNHFYQQEAALFAEDYSWEGFRWLDLHDAQRSILAFLRRAPASGEEIYVVCNFTPVVRQEYRLGVTMPGMYREVLNSDAVLYGGSGVCNEGELMSRPTGHFDLPYSIELTLPPLGIVFLKCIGQSDEVNDGE